MTAEAVAAAAPAAAAPAVSTPTAATVRYQGTFATIVAAAAAVVWVVGDDSSAIGSGWQVVLMCPSFESQ